MTRVESYPQEKNGNSPSRTVDKPKKDPNKPNWYHTKKLNEARPDDDPQSFEPTLSREQYLQVLKLVKENLMPLPLAIGVARINPKKWEVWRRRFPLWEERLRRVAEEDAQATLYARVLAGGPPGTAALQVLERRWPETWGRKSLSPNKPQSLLAQVLHGAEKPVRKNSRKRSKATPEPEVKENIEESGE